MGDTMNDDHDLLQRYARDGGEEAFREIVSRYAGLVYATALRHVREASHAEEVAQNVFTLLARKASGIPRDASLAGWLHRSACHLARHLIRSEARRQAREIAAVSMSTPDNSPEAGWEEIQTVLDESLGSLRDDDREAVLLRFFRGLSLREVGGAMQTSEDAARMKINRALEKLRTSLARRGITSTAAALSGMLATHAAAADSPDLAVRLAAHALNAASQAATATLTHVAVMSTKAKIACITAGAALTAAIGTPVVMQRERHLRGDIAHLEEQIMKLSGSASVAPVTASAAASKPVAAKPKVNPLAEIAAQAAGAKALLGNGNGKAAIAKALAGMMKMPGIKQLLVSQTKPVIEMMYADLLDELWQLSPDQRAKVMDILLETMTEAQLSGIEMMQEGIDEGNAKALSEKMAAASAQRDEKIKEILNDPAKFVEFQRYEDSIAERHKLNQFKEALSTKDAALAMTAEQEERLMNMMHRERKALNLGTPLEHETKFDPARYTPEMLNAQRDKSARLQEKILAESRAILKPDQHEVFSQSLKSVRAMEEMSFEMAQTLFGRKAD